MVIIETDNLERQKLFLINNIKCSETKKFLDIIVQTKFFYI